jgi:hypothetical protein
VCEYNGVWLEKVEMVFIEANRYSFEKLSEGEQSAKELGRLKVASIYLLGFEKKEITENAEGYEVRKWGKSPRILAAKVNTDFMMQNEYNVANLFWQELTVLNWDSQLSFEIQDIKINQDFPGFFMTSVQSESQERRAQVFRVTGIENNDEPLISEVLHDFEILRYKEVGICFQSNFLVTAGLNGNGKNIDATIQVTEFSSDFERILGVQTIDMENIFKKQFKIGGIDCDTTLGLVHFFMTELIEG